MLQMVLHTLLRKLWKKRGDKASEEEKTAIEAAIAEVEEAVKGDDKEAMDAAANKLSEASSALAQKLYAEQAAEEGQQAEGALKVLLVTAGDSAEDVVDAEFEEVKEDDKK